MRRLFGSMAFASLFAAAVWILAMASLAFGHLGRHVYRCKGGLIIHEWQVDFNEDGQADVARYFIRGPNGEEKKPFAELFHKDKGAGVVNGKKYATFEAMRKEWSTVCDAARASRRPA